MNEDIGKQIASTGLGWGKLSATCEGCNKSVLVAEAILHDKYWWHKKCLPSKANKKE